VISLDKNKKKKGNRCEKKIKEKENGKIMLKIHQNFT